MDTTDSNGATASNERDARMNEPAKKQGPWTPEEWQEFMRKLKGKREPKRSRKTLP
jgi:hypothetical protein